MSGSDVFSLQRGRSPFNLRPISLMILVLVHIHQASPARGAMVKWLERSLVKQEDLGSIPAQTNGFFSPLVWG